MKLEEEKRVWEALDLLLKAAYAIDGVAAQTEDKYIYRKFANAAAEIKRYQYP